MPTSWKLSLAALAITAVIAPVGIALAAGDEAGPSRAGAIAAPLAGHPSLRSQMQRAADRLARRGALRRAARRRALERRAVQVSPLLRSIAACESHGNPRAIGGGGQFRGLLQFTRETWQSVGGKGDPIDASAQEQYRRGALLLARSGPGQWPVCSR